MPEARDNVHILIVGGKPGNARLLSRILFALGVSEVDLAADTGPALERLAQRDFQAVFCDEAVGPTGMTAFVRAVRRRKALRNPHIPIIVTAKPLKQIDVMRMRDLGVNDFIVLPLTAGAVKRKLSAALIPVKGFVDTQSYFGPDRRRAHERRRARQAIQKQPLQERRMQPRKRRRTDAKI